MDFTQTFLETAQEQQQQEQHAAKARFRGCLTVSAGTILVLFFLGGAGVFSIHVGLKVLNAASQVQAALAKLQTVLALLYAFACQNETLNIFTPEECKVLCTVSC